MMTMTTAHKIYVKKKRTQQKEKEQWKKTKQHSFISVIHRLIPVYTEESKSVYIRI